MLRQTEIRLVLLFLLSTTAARADGMANAPARVDATQFVKRDELNAVQSLIMSAIPLPNNATPKGDGVGSPGDSIGYMRGDAVHPSQWRGEIATLDATGAASGTWASPFASSQPVPGSVSPINQTGQATCNFTAPPTQTGYSIKCAGASAGAKVGVTAMEAQ